MVDSLGVKFLQELTAYGSKPTWEESKGFAMHPAQLHQKTRYKIGASRRRESARTLESIDAAMKLGMNHPMGPLTLADLIGLDVVLFNMEVLQCDLDEEKYRSALLLRKMVDAVYLGSKAGRGFYRY